MMKKRTSILSKGLFLLAVVFGTAVSPQAGKLQGQEAVQFSQFFVNRLFYNPAAINTDGLFRASLTDREQWWGTPNHPSYRLLNASYYFKDKNMGVGMSLHQWNANIENNVVFKIDYMYCLQVGYDAYINFGVNLGVKRRFLSDGILANGDVYVSTGDEFNPNMDMGLGIEFHTSEIIAGFSAQNLPIKLGKSPSLDAFHTYFYFGYNFVLDPDWSLFPMVAARIAEKSANVDVSLRAVYRDVIQFGLIYRIDALVITAGININRNFGLSYAFDANIGRTSKAYKPSHELTLTYRADFKRPDRPLVPTF